MARKFIANSHYINVFLNFGLVFLYIWVEIRGKEREETNREKDNEKNVAMGY